MEEKKELNIDFVVVTGDIADKARPEDYEVAGKMCERILKAAKLGKDRLFMVPGNHDVDRTSIKKWHRGIYEFETENDIADIMTDPECMDHLRSKFQSFDFFAKSAMESYPLEPLSFCYAIPLTIKKEKGYAKINMLGLNSAIFCGYRGGGKPKNGNTKMELEKLALGKVQVHSALDRMAQNARLTISFFHLPLGTSFHPADGVCRSLLLKKGYQGMVPVFLPLRELKSVKAGLDSFIQEQLSDANLGTPPGFGKKLLEDRGNLLLLFDGLDEISDFKHRQKVSRWIENALQYHHKSCFFVATSRFAGYKDNVRLNEHFLEMHVRSLSEEHAGQFIRNWYSIVESGVMTDKRQAKITAEKKTNALIRRLRAPELRTRRVFEMTRTCGDGNPPP